MNNPQKRNLSVFWPQCLLLIVAGLLGHLPLHADLLPPNRIANWEDAGIPGGIPNYPVGVDVTSYGAVGDGSTDDTQAFKDAIAACENGHAIYIPDGTYRLTDTLNLTKSIALRGESRLGTTLNFDHTKNGIFIGAYTGSSGEIDLTGGLSRGSTVVTASHTSNRFAAGQIVEIKQDNDPNVYQQGYKGYESWTDRQTAMMNQIENVQGNVITLKHPLILNFDTSFNPTIRAQDTIYRAGIENLTLDRFVESSTASTQNVYFFCAIQSWVKDIWSEKTYVNHIRLTRSLQCEIRGNVIHDAWMTKGGQGYGIAVQDRSTLNLIEDNSASNLRHSYLVQAGASGNVFGYNFSRESGSILCDHCVFSDLSAHGSMANYTLWEGNKVIQIYIDNVHGSNPWNTAFRNHATKPNSSYVGIDLEKTSKWCSLIGNVIGNMGSIGYVISVDPSVESTSIVTGNLNGITGTTEWDPNYDQTLPNSLYLDEKPASFGSKPWPIFGPEIGAATTLPAEDRWYSLSNTIPASEAPIATEPVGFIEALLDPVVYFDSIDDGTGILPDLSGNFISGTLNGATITVGGSHDGSDTLTFDGVDDEVVVGDHPFLGLKEEMTLSAWVRTKHTGTDQSILSKNNAYYMNLYRGSNGARIRVGLSIGGSWQTLTSPSTPSIPENTWAHIACSYDGVNLRIYLNGEEIATKAVTGDITTNGKDLEIGTLWNGNRMNGDIDHITIFDTALDEAEIELLYTGEWLNPVVPDPVIDFRFEEGSGSTTVDAQTGIEGTMSGTNFDSDSIEGNYSLRFNGSTSKVVVDQTSLLDISDSISIAAWVNSNDPSSHQCIVGKNSSYYIYLYSGANASRLRAGFRINGSWVAFTSSYLEADKIPPNTWTHVAMTYDGNHIRFYVDGENVGTYPQTGAINISNKDVELGTIWNGFRFNGKMDAVQIYDLALTPDEVKSLAE